MKIGVLSDLHADTNSKALREGETFSSLLSELLKEKEVDLLLLAGDNTGEAEASHVLNQEIENKSGVPVLFVPGNHDLWSRTNGRKDTEKLYRELTEKPESLIGKPRILSDEWAVAGTGGWYDYGYADHKKYTIEEFEKKHFRFAHWNDAHYVHWKKSDPEIAEEMYVQLQQDLHSVGSRKIILMTHIVTHPDFVVPLPNKMYSYFNAFLGSTSYEKLYQDFPIHYSIMGHVHFRKILKENGTEFISACLGGKKHWVGTDARQELERTLVTFEI